MKPLFLLSVLFNIAIISFGIIFITKHGGISYIKHKVIKQENNDDRTIYELKRDKQENETVDSNQIIIVGNSLVDNCNWKNLFPEHNIVNRGIERDLIIGVTNRIKPILSLKPSKLFLIIGINDLGKGNSIDQIINDYNNLIDTIFDTALGLNLYIHSITPTIFDEKRPNNKIVEINNRLKAICLKREIQYIDIHTPLLDAKGRMDEAYSYDGLHLNKKGYLVWREILKYYIVE